MVKLGTRARDRLVKRRAADGVVRATIDMICSGEITPGQRIGSETELITHFGVSRAVVREALRLLEREGVVSVKPGPTGGVFCERAGTESLSQSLGVFGTLHHIPPSDLLEARLELEVLCASMAARHATEEDMARLIQLNEEGERLIERGDREAINEVNKQFHLALAEAAHNQVFIAVMAALEDLVLEADLEPRYSENLSPITDSHRFIVEALRRHSSSEAAERTREHLRRFRPAAWQH